MVPGENKHWILMVNIMMDINKRQDQTLTLRSNIYVCNNNGRDLYAGCSAINENGLVSPKVKIA